MALPGKQTADPRLDWLLLCPLLSFLCTKNTNTCKIHQHSGAFGKKKPLKRYHDDIWLFDIKSEKWSQPAQATVDADGDRLRP